VQTKPELLSDPDFDFDPDFDIPLFMGPEVEIATHLSKH
jgi:hypothetical protein